MQFSKSLHCREITAIIIREEAVIVLLQPFGVKIGNKATREAVRQELIYQRKRCIPAGKRVDHAAAWAEYASTIREERRIVSNMLDDGAGYDEVGRGVAKRKPICRGIGNYLVLELTVATQFFLRKVKRNDQLPRRGIEIV